MIIVCKLSFSIEISLEIACIDLVSQLKRVHMWMFQLGSYCVTTYYHGFSRNCDGKIPENLFCSSLKGV